MNFIEWLQSRLTAHGFPCGVIDGVFGDLTEQALVTFQFRRFGPGKITAVADAATIAALRERSTEAKTGIERDEDAAAAAVVRNVWPRQRDVRRMSSIYGAVGTNQARVSLPFPMKLAWDTSKVVTRMSLHERVAESAARCFERIADAYDEGQRTALGLDLFGGSLNVRRIRGGNSYSMHSWGIAIDFDPVRNQLRWGRDRARLAQADARTFWRIWEDEGWISLGREKNYDWMHVQAARL